MKPENKPDDTCMSWTRFDTKESRSRFEEGGGGLSQASLIALLAPNMYTGSIMSKYSFSSYFLI